MLRGEKMVKSVFLFCFFVLYSINAFSDNARPDNIKDLCNHDVEGTYLGTVGSDKVRINLICLMEGDLSATVCPEVDNKGDFGTDMVTNLGWADVENGRLVISNFALDNAARPGGSSKSIVSYLELDLPSIYAANQLKGVYMSGSMDQFQPVNAKRIQTFPKIAAVAKAALDQYAVAGVFRTDIPGDPKGTNMIFNNLAGTPVISIVDVGYRFVTHYTEGPLWDGSGVFSSATSEGNGGEPDDHKLSYVRGAFSDLDHVQFYIINPVIGLQGPYHGTRIPGTSAPLF